VALLLTPCRAGRETRSQIGIEWSHASTIVATEIVRDEKKRMKKDCLFLKLQSRLGPVGTF
jgi:hypothetical protein